jgi:hypothetical protein
MSAKTVTVWIMGGIFLLVGVWIINNLKMDIGVSEASYIMALLISLVLFLLAGLCWISVAVATKR